MVGSGDWQPLEAAIFTGTRAGVFGFEVKLMPSDIGLGVIQEG